MADRRTPPAGADPGLGARLAELFFEAGVKIRETGTIQNSGHETSIEEWEIEWEVIESDLHEHIPGQELQRMKATAPWTYTALVKCGLIQPPASPGPRGVLLQSLRA